MLFLAQVFGVKQDEVGILRLEHKNLVFCYPARLHDVGSIPLNTSTSVAVRAANHDDITGTQLHGLATLATQSHADPTGGDAEHLARAAVIVRCRLSPRGWTSRRVARIPQ